MLFKRWVLLLIWLCLGLCIVLLFLFIRLPHLVESQIEQRLAQFLDPAEFEFKIQTIGLSHAYVSNIRAGQGLSIDSVAINYDIRQVPAVHVGTMVISGLTLQARLDETNQIKVQGLKWPSAPANAPSGSGHLSFLPDKIVLQNAKIMIQAFDDEVLIPLDGAVSVSVDDHIITLRATGYLFGEKLETVMVYDMNTGIKSFRVEGKAFDLEHLNAFIAKKTEKLRLGGPLDFVVESSLPQKKWTMNFSRVQFAHPMAASLESVLTTLDLDEKSIRAAGKFDLSCEQLPATRVAYTASVDLNKGHRFEVNLNASTAGPCSVTAGATAVRVKNPQFTARVKGTVSKSRATISLKTGQGQLEHQAGTVFFSDGEFRSDVTADFSDPGRGVSSTFFVIANTFRIRSDSIESNFPLATASGTVKLDQKKRPFGRMTLKASNGNLWAKEFKTKAFGLDFEFPLQYPVTDHSSRGRWSVSKITRGNQYHFSSHGNIFQTDATKFQITGDVRYRARPDINTRFDGWFTFGKKMAAHLVFGIDPFQINAADLDQWIPQEFDGAVLNATISAKGTADYTDHGLDTMVQLGIENGDLGLPEYKVTAKGIHAAVTLNDLMAWESVPGQVLTIDSIQADKIKLDDVNIRFSLEDARFLLVENIGFKWCNGRVSSEAIRFPQDTGEYAFTLYCDRLELSQLLSQTRAFDARGTGTLNGRIPVMYSDGNISFDNGFLFSTPGSGGKVVLKNTDRILAGIPMDSPQFAQLDLAREALKDYDYQWAKLVFHTFEDSLYVTMELDGKPSKPLPFVYQKEVGGFVRVNAKSPGSRFQGIKLDVNLKLPFNQVMKFGNKLKSILQ